MMMYPFLQNIYLQVTVSKDYIPKFIVVDTDRNSILGIIKSILIEYLIVIYLFQFSIDRNKKLGHKKEVILIFNWCFLGIREEKPSLELKPWTMKRKRTNHFSLTIWGIKYSKKPF